MKLLGQYKDIIFDFDCQCNVHPVDREDRGKKCG